MANNAFSLEGKTAIVTGGGTGIGKSIAIEFARAGADVAICSRKLEHLEPVEKEAKAEFLEKQKAEFLEKQKEKNEKYTLVSVAYCFYSDSVSGICRFINNIEQDELNHILKRFLMLNFMEYIISNMIIILKILKFQLSMNELKY